MNTESTRFDPHHIWLGIPPDEHPPNHYRLLGLHLFEDDPDVIENAADSRMAYLRTFHAGPHSALSQKLLNEVAAARVCLLSTERKAAYDSALRSQLTLRTTTPPMVVVPPAATSPGAEMGPDIDWLLDANEPAGAANRFRGLPKANRRVSTAIFFAVALVAASAVAGAILWGMNRVEPIHERKVAWQDRAWFIFPHFWVAGAHLERCPERDELPITQQEH